MLRPIKVRNVLTSGTNGVGGGMRAGAPLKRCIWRLKGVVVAGIDIDELMRRGACVRGRRRAMA